MNIFMQQEYTYDTIVTRTDATWRCARDTPHHRVTEFSVLNPACWRFIVSATSMNPKRTAQALAERWLTIDEVRTVSDLRIMHAKVDELYQIVSALKGRYDDGSIVRYADQPVLTQDIQRVDEIYLWFVRLKEESISQRSENA